MYLYMYNTVDLNYLTILGSAGTCDYTHQSIKYMYVNSYLYVNIMSIHSSCQPT